MVYARYSSFSVGSEIEKYQLSIEEFSGSADDMMIQAYNLNGSYFSTKDRDNDHNSYNCAAKYHPGGWWFNSCTHSNLNGVYQTSNKQNRESLFWGINGENMKSTKMMLRSK
ncbi:ficolin-1-like [Saccostrea cucullata]|uniref:ficolin-1-like n=1 Tax=Saccostrea cuccullata TaxID=36930 RepID=UPI002ED488B9